MARSRPATSKKARVAGAEQTRALVIGPPEAGKTVLLGAMALAANLSHARNDNQQACEIVPRNDAMSDLLQRAAEILAQGYFAGLGSTDVIHEYEFDVVVQQQIPGWFGRRRMQRVARFEVVDGPGGNLFFEREVIPGSKVPSTEPALRQELLERARLVTDLILCVDGTNKDRATTFASHLPTLVGEIRQGSATWGLKRLVILLTKADLCFYRLGRKAEEAASRDNPWVRIPELLTDLGLGALLGVCRASKTAVVASWVSAYGFIPRYGSANYDSTTGKLLTADSRPKIAAALANLWEPFRALDPLLYLTTGEVGTLFPYSDGAPGG